MTNMGKWVYFSSILYFIYLKLRVGVADATNCQMFFCVLTNLLRSIFDILIQKLMMDGVAR